MISRGRLVLPLISGLVCGATAASAQHPVLDSIDLYPYGCTICNKLAVYRNVLYASADGTSCSANTLHSVDVSNPVDLAHISSGGGGGCKSYGLEIVNDTLYVAHWFSGIRVYDVSNPGHFLLLWAYDDGNAFWNVDVYRQRAYATASEAPYSQYYGMRIIDISNRNPPNPSGTLVSFLNTSDRNVDGVAVKGSYAYYTDGLSFEVANISDENHPYILRTFSLPDSYKLNGVRLRGDYAYVYGSGGTPGLVIYDISDPSNPVEKSRYTQAGAMDMYLLGDYALMAGSGGGLVTLDISNPLNPRAVTATHVDAWTDAVKAWEDSVTGNGRYAYVGTQELYYYPPGHPDAGNNYYRGKLYTLQVLDKDPDNAGPGDWSGFSLGEASWDTQYDGDALPTAASTPWQVLEGTETWASTSEGVLRVNDTGTASGDKLKWWRNWEATNTCGTTVLLRARCASYDLGGTFAYPGNLYIEDGRFVEEFSILSDRIRANFANIEYSLDGAEWHTYRVTTQGAQFKVYVDENPLPAVTGPLSMTTQRARIIFGSGSSPARQDIYFDYLHCASDDSVGPVEPIVDQAPTLSAAVADTEGKGSLSGISPSSARVLWSTDGGANWNSSGGSLWDGQYEANALPSVSLPSWTVPEGDESWASVASGILHISDNSTAWGSKVKWARAWQAAPSKGATLLARARCTATGGDTTLLGNLFVENGARREQFKIMTDRIETAETSLSYALDGTAWHVYRITVKDNRFDLYVDEAPAAVLSGTMIATTTENRVMFGSGASLGTQEIDFDYVRYTSSADLPPGQGDGDDTVMVECTGTEGDDRGLITAHNVPFNQGSQTLNKVRFSLRDTAGNLGLSPIYNVAIAVPPNPDADGDGDVDQADFGVLQGCLSGSGVLYDLQTECGKADFDQDRDVDADDFAIFRACMRGPGQPPGC